MGSYVPTIGLVWVASPHVAEHSPHSPYVRVKEPCASPKKKRRRRRSRRRRLDAAVPFGVVNGDVVRLRILLPSSFISRSDDTVVYYVQLTVCAAHVVVVFRLG